MNSMRWAARLLLLPLLILNFAPFAYSEERSSIFLEDLTWTELRDEIGGGKTTIIVPIGGTEQNGPVMALGKHNRRVKLLSELIAVGLGDAIVVLFFRFTILEDGGEWRKLCRFLLWKRRWKSFLSDGACGGRQIENRR